MATDQAAHRVHAAGAGQSQLCTEDRAALLRIARQALIDYFRFGRVPHPTTDRPALLVPRASFVTLRVRATGELRGCRGEVLAQRALAESVARNAIASAVDDPRFEPVSSLEAPLLHIEISALTHMRPIRPEDVEVGRHGLLIRRGFAGGLLLPQVPAQHGWDREAFLRGVCRKAGMREDAWRASDIELLAFEAEVWGEPESPTRVPAPG